MSNIESGAAKSAAGAATGNNALGGITGWLRKMGKGKDSESSATSPVGKSGAEYHNETLAKMYEHSMTESGKTGDVNRTLRLGRANKKGELGLQGHVSDGQRHEARFYKPDAPARTVPSASSSGGQGTSGNVQGKQFKSSGVDEMASHIGSVLGGGIAAAASKNPKVAAAGAQIGGQLAKAGVQAVRNRKARPPMPTVASQTPSSSIKTAVDAAGAKAPRATRSPKA